MDKHTLEYVELKLKLHAPNWAGTTAEMVLFGLPDFLTEVGMAVGDLDLGSLLQDMLAKEAHHRQVTLKAVHLTKEERKLVEIYSYEWWCDYDVQMMKNHDRLYNTSRVVNQFIWTKLLREAKLTADTIPADAMSAILTFELMNTTHPRLRPTGSPYRLVRAFGPF
jgi:hypothetical protein